MVPNKLGLPCTQKILMEVSDTTARVQADQSYLHLRIETISAYGSANPSSTYLQQRLMSTTRFTV